MKKRKKDVFSAAKAVKALARERVGQPKASRVIVPKAKAEREAEAAAGLQLRLRQRDPHAEAVVLTNVLE